MLKKNKYIWICGYHSTLAALKNQGRDHKTLFVTDNFYHKNKEKIKEYEKYISIKIVDKNVISNLFPPNTAHQGIAVQTTQLQQLTLEDVLFSNNERSLVVALDQVTDIGNIGAIIRSCAAFDVDAVLLTKHGTPQKSSLSKTASGTLESVPLIYINNLANTIKMAQKHGFWCYGMDEKGEHMVHQTRFAKKSFIIFGSEKSGIRRLVKDNCDFLVKIPTSDHISSLNVSNAASITLYAAYINSL